MNTSGTFETRKMWIVDLHILIGSFLFQYTLGVFNPCQDNVAASLGWGSNKDSYTTLFSSLVPVGALVGTALTAPLIDRFGRRSTTMGTDIFYALGTVILVMPSTVTFGIGRFLTGLGAGLFMTIGPIHITEMTPEAMMAKAGPLIVIVGNVGLMTAYGLGLALPTSDFENDPFNYWWLFMFILPAAIAMYQFCYFKFVCKYDTPQYYMGKNMYEEAKRALGLTYTQSGMTDGLRRLNSDVRGKFGTGAKPSLISMFTNQRFRKMMRVGCVLCMLYQLSGLTAILFYSTSIFNQLGGGIFLSRLLTFIMGIVNLISSACSIFLLQFFGRKAILVSGQLFVAIDLLLIGLFSGYINGGVAAPSVLIIAFFSFFSYSLGATLWLYIAEVLNDQIFSVSCAMCMAISVLISFLFPSAVAGIGINNVFLIFSGFMFLGACYSMVDLIETKGKDKEQILIEMKVMEPSKIQPEENDSLQDQGNDYENNKEIGSRSGLDMTTINKNDREIDNHISEEIIDKDQNDATKQGLGDDSGREITGKIVLDITNLRQEA